jgi:hypothetical protein
MRMKSVGVEMLSLLIVLLFGGLISAQQSVTTATNAQVPPVIQFSDVAADEAGSPLSGTAWLTFSLYNNARGGEPLWTESETVQLDSTGHYSVYLGITKANGVPLSLFTSGQAHWLGVQIAGQAEQPRIFLVSVPYAMKAGDAATIGGLPPSAFVMANAPNSSHASNSTGKPNTKAQATETQNYIPFFTDGSGDLGNSILYEAGGNEIGIGTTTPSATLEVNGTAKFDGLATFNSAQTFPGTLMGVTAGTGISVTGSKTDPTININTTFANEFYPQLDAANTFTKNQTVNGTMTATSFSGNGAGITNVTATNSSELGGLSASAFAQLSLANTFAPQQVIKGNGNNAVIGDPGCNNGFSGIGLTTSSLSGCINYTLIGKTTGDVYLNSTSSGSIHFRNNNDNGDLVTIDKSGNLNVIGQNGGGNVAIAGSLTVTGQENLNYKELINANSNYQALDVTQSGGTGDGMDATTTSAVGNGVMGNSPFIGVYGNSTGNGGLGYGVYGQVTAALGIGVSGSSTGAGGVGVSGSSPNIGVYGQSASASQTGKGLTIWGGTWGDTGGTMTGFPGTGPVGILGTADNSNAGVFINNSSVFNTVAIENDGGGGTCGGCAIVLGTSGGTPDSGRCTINAAGDVGCTGRVGADAPIEGGARKVSLYAMQSPENWFEDAGSGQLSNGSITIALDPIFAQTVNAGVEYHVFLTPNGDCKGLYVSQKSSASFEVRELSGGTSHVTFDYRIMAKRNGYENVRLADVTEKYRQLEAQKARRIARRNGETNAASAAAVRGTPQPR